MADKPPVPFPPSAPFPGSRTPGWNDPPTLQFNPQGTVAAAGGKSRLNLNKRVAFPLQGTVGGEINITKPTAIVPPNVSSCGFPMPPPTAPIAIVHPIVQHPIVPPIAAPLQLYSESSNMQHEELERRSVPPAIFMPRHDSNETTSTTSEDAQAGLSTVQHI